MFHLFKRVYLDHDINVSLNVKRAVLSTMAGFDLDEKYKDTLASLLLFNTPTPSEMTSAEICDLMQRLWMLEEKIVVFCDADTYARIVAWWLKGIVRGDALNLYRLLLQSIDLRELAEWGMKRHPHLLTRTVDVEEIWNSTARCQNFTAFIQRHLDDISAEYHLLKHLLGEDDSDRRVLKNIGLIVRRALNDYGRERHEKEYMSAFAELTGEEMAKVLETNGDGVISDLMVREINFETSVDVAMRTLHIAPGGDEAGRQFKTLIEGIFEGKHDVDKIVDAFFYLCSRSNPALSIISSGDIANFNFPFINGVAAHRELLLKDVTL